MYIYRPYPCSFAGKPDSSPPQFEPTSSYIAKRNCMSKPSAKIAAAWPARLYSGPVRTLYRRISYICAPILYCKNFPYCWHVITAVLLGVPLRPTKVRPSREILLIYCTGVFSRSSVRCRLDRLYLALPCLDSYPPTS